MSRTVLAQSPIEVTGIATPALLTGAEDADTAEGIAWPFGPELALLVANLHESGDVSVTLDAVRTVLERADTLTVNDPDPIVVAPGTMRMIGPLTQANFRDSEGNVNLDFDYTGGVTDSDVKLRVIKIR